MLDDSSRIINTSESSDEGDNGCEDKGKVIRRTLNTKDDIKNYVKHLI